MGNSAKEQGPTVAELLLGPNTIVRKTVVRALSNMAPLDQNTVLTILAASYVYPYDAEEYRLLANIVAGDDFDSSALISLLGNSNKKTLSKADIKNSRETLNVLLNSWDFTETHQEMREDLIIAITEVAKSGNWTTEDAATLKKAEDTLKSNGSADQAETIRSKIAELGG